MGRFGDLIAKGARSGLFGYGAGSAVRAEDEKTKLYGEAETAAEQIQQQTLSLLGEEKGLALKAAESQFTTGQENIGMGANMELRRTQAFGDQAYSQSNLATSGTIEQKVQTQTGDLMQKYKTDMTKLFETRDLSKAAADLSYRKGEVSADKAFADTMAGFEEGDPTAGAVEGGIESFKSVLSLFSDKRLKESVDYIGDSLSGIRIYEFNYLNNDTRYRGVMADDLVDSHPNAVSKNKNGYYMVDYSQIDVNFEIVKGD